MCYCISAIEQKFTVLKLYCETLYSGYILDIVTTVYCIIKDIVYIFTESKRREQEGSKDL